MMHVQCEYVGSLARKIRVGVWNLKKLALGGYIATLGQIKDLSAVLFSEQNNVFLL